MSVKIGIAVALVVTVCAAYFRLSRVTDSPVSKAIRENDTATLTTLLNKGMSPNTRIDFAMELRADEFLSFTQYHRLPFGLFAPKSNSAPVGMPILTFAALFGKAEIVKLLLQKGASINAKDTFGQTALMVSAWNGNTDVMVELLKAEPDYSLRDDSGMTAFGWAAAKTNVPCLAFLADAGGIVV